MRESSDLLALICLLLLFTGFFAVSLRVWMLRVRQKGTVRLGLSGVLLLLSAIWLVQSALDLNSSWALVGNGVDDIPPTTLHRLAIQAAWFWMLWAVLPRLAKDKLK